MPSPGILIRASASRYLPFTCRQPSAPRRVESHAATRVRGFEEQRPVRMWLPHSQAVIAALPSRSISHRPPALAVPGLQVLRCLSGCLARRLDSLGPCGGRSPAARWTMPGRAAASVRLDEYSGTSPLGASSTPAKEFERHHPRELASIEPSSAPRGCVEPPVPFAPWPLRRQRSTPASDSDSFVTRSCSPGRVSYG